MGKSRSSLPICIAPGRFDEVGEVTVMGDKLMSGMGCCCSTMEE